MSITSKALVEFAENALSERWGYVLSGQGETYSKELAEFWAKVRTGVASPEYFIKDCARWFGHIVVDCSGLIVQAMRSADPGYSDRTANTFRSQFVESGPIASIPEISGLAVWREGHIGIYIGNGQVIEAAGYRWGVVQTPINAPKGGKSWTHWGKLRDVDYSVEKPPAANKPPATSAQAFTLGRLLKYGLVNRIIKIRGADVEAVQKILAKLGLYTGSIDGVFGKLTRAAVMLFQRQKGLKIDGIVGKITCAALGGKWAGK